MSPILLPDDLRNSHEYAISVHDEIVELVKAGAEQGVWGEVGIQIRPEHDATAFSLLEGESLWDWLEERGYQDALDEMALRNTASAVSSDFCNFVLEALQCSEKGKLTVSYALLRKPFRESLYILEWMLADRTAFLSAFHGMEAEPLSVGTRLPPTDAPRNHRKSSRADRYDICTSGPVPVRFALQPHGAVRL